VINHVWSVLCQNAVVDNETGSVSLINILETITVFSEAKGEVKIPISYEIFSEWIREENNHPATGMMRLFFCNAQNECKHQLELPIDLREHLFARTRIKLAGLTINGSGWYKFLVELKIAGSDKWELKASLPLMVVFASESEEKLNN